MNSLTHTIVTCLETAFGGASQFGPHLYGQALAGQINNNGITTAEAKEAFAGILNYLAEYWQEDKAESWNTYLKVLEGLQDYNEKWEGSVKALAELITELKPKTGWAVVYDCGWMSIECCEKEPTGYSNESGWFPSWEEANNHANQLNGCW
jgi:hypothetical protein